MIFPYASISGHSVMAGIDVDKPENMNVRVDYNITGFPTLLYFVNGKMKFKYGGENNKVIGHFAIAVSLLLFICKHIVGNLKSVKFIDTHLHV